MKDSFKILRKWNDHECNLQNKIKIETYNFTFTLNQNASLRIKLNTDLTDIKTSLLDNNRELQTLSISRNKKEIYIKTKNLKPGKYIVRIKKNKNKKENKGDGKKIYLHILKSSRNIEYSEIKGRILLKDIRESGRFQSISRGLCHAFKRPLGTGVYLLDQECATHNNKEGGGEKDYH